MREITNIVKGRWNDSERENILVKLSERTSLTLDGERSKRKHK
jgi:hypothetical protein